MTRVPLGERHHVTRVLAPGHQTVRDVCTRRPVGANHGPTRVIAIRRIYWTMRDEAGGLPTGRCTCGTHPRCQSPTFLI
jgi:hypothetical protein